MDEANEILTLVNDKDEVIGSIPRQDIDKLKDITNKYIRVVNAFIVRSDNKVWVPTRSTQKRIAPGGLDYSIAGHVETGEDYNDALLRELSEEAGIKGSAEDFVEIAHYKTNGSFSNFFCKLFIINTNVTPTLSNEHTHGEFMTIGELLLSIKSGAPIKNGFEGDVAVLANFQKEGSLNVRPKRI